MRELSLKLARSLLGRNVNLHLKDGSVIVNVLPTEVERDYLKKKAFITCRPYRKNATMRIPLRDVAWADTLGSKLFFCRGVEPKTLHKNLANNLK